MIVQIPNIGLLRHQLEAGIPADQFRSSYFALELLPYSLGATCQALFDFIQEERHLVEQTFAIDSNVRTIHAIGRGGRDKLSYRIDSFLETARRTQNAVIPYISKALSVSLPMSLSDLVKKTESGTVELPDKIKSDVLGYWTAHGKTLKDYRDLSQHHALVASEVRIFHSSEGKPAIYISLPNNPDQKNPANHVFDNPTIQAFYYMRDEFLWLIRFVYEVVTGLVKIPEGDVRAVSEAIVFRHPITLVGKTRLVGHHLIADDELQRQIDEMTATLAWV